MKKTLLRFFFAITMVTMVIGASFPAFSASAAPEAGVTLPTQPIAYAPDFATNEFHDAWDMSELTDVSQYLNGSGRHVSLANPAVANGLFSATTLGDYTANLGYFYMLFPDYPNMSQTGKLGVLHPIKTSQYSCMYISMKVNSNRYTWPVNPAYDPFPDSFRVMWYKNDNMSPQGAAPNGGTQPIKLHWDDVTYTDNYPTRLQKIYKINLNNPPAGIYGAAWNSSSEWQGLEINPTMFKGISFDIDWVKLTNNCSAEPAYQAAISFTPSSTVNSIWVQPSGTTRNIRVAVDVNGASGRYSLDTKGLAAGKYKVGLGDKTSCCSQWSTTELTINTLPNVTILNPSTVSGADYSTSAGNAWDMEPSDVITKKCADFNFVNGAMEITTQYPANLQQADCRGSSLGEADPQLFLNTPVSVAPNSGYRYLTFRMYQSGPWQYVADGMMVRWMWRTPDGCTFVGNDIPLDVGWHTYTIDLYDPINGTPLMATAPCSQLTPWKNAPTISSFRLDPNENYTGMVAGVPAMVFEQKIDWIKLTRLEQVKAGTSFTIQTKIDKALPASAVTYYYTTNLATPKQHTATAWSIQVNDPARPYRSFVPMLSAPQATADNGLLKYKWDTTGVTPGEYYICAEVNDSINTVLTCSTAPLAVTQ